MAASHGPHPVKIWIWLVGLLASGFVVFWLDPSQAMIVLALFGIALVKAMLVIRHYMHMKNQPVGLYVIAAVPVLLLIFMVLALLPDIAFYR
jgi:caa(3)-type oxidase subunit IV